MFNLRLEKCCWWHSKQCLSSETSHRKISFFGRLNLGVNFLLGDFLVGKIHRVFFKYNSIQVFDDQFNFSSSSFDSHFDSCFPGASVSGVSRKLTAGKTLSLRSSSTCIMDPESCGQKMDTGEEGAKLGVTFRSNKRTWKSSLTVLRYCSIRRKLWLNFGFAHFMILMERRVMFWEMSRKWSIRGISSIFLSKTELFNPLYLRLAFENSEAIQVSEWLSSILIYSSWIKFLSFLKSNLVLVDSHRDFNSIKQNFIKLLRFL